MYIKRFYNKTCKFRNDTSTIVINIIRVSNTNDCINTPHMIVESLLAFFSPTENIVIPTIIITL